MGQQFEVRWEGELPASPQDVWDGLTKHTDGYLWKGDYEPWVGWPVSVAHHFFAGDVDQSAVEPACSDWMAGVLPKAQVA